MVRYAKELPCNINGKWPSSRPWYIEFKNIIYFNEINYMDFFDFVNFFGLYIFIKIQVDVTTYKLDFK
jgi:hypothetical protein